MLGPGECALGIHVSEGRLRVVALQGGSSGPALAAVRDDPIPLVAVEESGVIRDPRALANAVAAAVGEHGIDPGSAASALAISGSSVLVRSLDLAQEGTPDIDAAVRAHVEHYSMFSMGDEIVGYEAHEHEGPEGESRLRVTLAATNRQVSESGWSMLRDVGGRAECVEASSLAACRAMAFAGELDLEAAAPTMALFLTSRRTQVLVICGRAVLFSHMLDLRAEDVAGGDDSATPEGHDRVATEVARCVQFFQRQFRDAEPLQQILFVSDAPIAREFYDKVAEATGVAARASAPLSGVPTAEQGGDVAELTNGSTLAPALGAALRAAEASDAFCIPLSVVRAERPKVDLRALAKMLAPGAILLLCFALGAIVTGSRAREADRREQFVEQQIAEVHASIAEGSDRLTAEQKAALLEAIEANKSLTAPGRATHAPEVIAALVEVLPVEARLENVTIDKEGDVSISGSIRSEADAVALTRAFEASEFIAFARLSSLRAAEADGEAYFDFDIVASVR